MAVIKTTKQPEQWLIEVNGSYDVCFETREATADVQDGEIVDGGIVSGTHSTGEKMRVMVRGNPSIVDGSQLTGDVATLPDSILVK